MSVGDIFFGLLPLVFAIGAIGLVLAQLIYMSEIGADPEVEDSSRRWEVALIFLPRTAITLPIIAFMAHSCFF